MADIKLTESEIKALDLMIALMQEEESGITPQTVATIPAVVPTTLITVTRVTPTVTRVTPTVTRATRATDLVTDLVGVRAADVEFSPQQQEAVRELEAQLEQEVTLEQLLEIRRNLQMDK